jgi:dTDP-4-amino-4,6-dideoxygalactose transaminase
MDSIVRICDRYGVPLIEDAAEALGASYRGRAPGGFGESGIFSFNGNKIITTSGGGMLVSNNEALIRHARKLATQARDPAPHYQHSEVGYNYRMSNVLAAIGVAQLATLEDRVLARRGNFDDYFEGLGGLPGIKFMPEAPWGRHTRWLTCLTIDPEEFGASCETVRLALESDGVEARPLWKPMHLQPVFSSFESFGGDVAKGLFQKGLCLPSGSTLTAEERATVIQLVKEVPAREAAALRHSARLAVGSP